MFSNGIGSFLSRAPCTVGVFATVVLGISFSAAAQTSSNVESFAVATIKPVLIDASHPFNPAHYGPRVTPAGASFWSMTIKFLVSYAYGVDSVQIAGPERTTTDHFDIEARFPEGAVKQDDRKMLQALLTDRFKLAFHVEKRELEIYSLVIGEHGAKLKPSSSDPVKPEAGAASKRIGSKVNDGHTKAESIQTVNDSRTSDVRKNATQTVMYDSENHAQHWELSKMTMGDLAERLAVCIDSSHHKVVDDTGLVGNYKVAYDCPLPTARHSLGTNAAGTLALDLDDGSVLTRSLDALGLRLEKRKVPMDVYLIDHVEAPTEN